MIALLAAVRNCTFMDTNFLDGVYFCRCMLSWLFPWTPLRGNQNIPIQNGGPMVINETVLLSVK